MTTRFGFIVTAGLLVACAGDKPADKAPDPAAEETAAQAAIAKLHTDYTTHFNLHHASAVADLYADSSGYFGADGSIDQGKPAIQKGLEETMAERRKFPVLSSLAVSNAPARAAAFVWVLKEPREPSSALPTPITKSPSRTTRRSRRRSPTASTS